MNACPCRVVPSLLAGLLLGFAPLAASGEGRDTTRRVPKKRTQDRSAVVSISESGPRMQLRNMNFAVDDAPERGGTYWFTAIPDDGEPLRPKQFTRMWGSREGMAILASTLAELFSGVDVNVERISPPHLHIYSDIEAVAAFEDGEVTRILVARIEDGEVLLSLYGGTAGPCGASPPGSNGECWCQGNGSGKSCTTGSNGDGSTWAKCVDGPNEPLPDTTLCTYKSSGDCGCKDIAAQ